jgi:hypothetical protein
MERTAEQIREQITWIEEKLLAASTHAEEQTLAKLDEQLWDELERVTNR